MSINAYHKDGKIIIEMSVTTAEKLRREINDLTSLNYDYKTVDELYSKLYYQTQN